MTLSLRPSTASALLYGLLATCSANVQATEGGGTLYPNGAESFSASAMPPPGFYGMVFANHYSADRVNDASGNNLFLPGFKVRADAVMPRFIWITGAKFLSGDVSLHALLPLVDMKVSAGEQSQGKSGIGDITLGPGLGYHHSENLHSLAGVDFYLPTGQYDKNDLANIGCNHYVIEPLNILSYIDPKGFNGDIKLGYLFNQRNQATDYRSGQEFHFDYAAGWGLGNGLTAGLGGYYYQQVSADRQAGAELANSKGKTFTIGPALKYDSGKG